MRNGSVVSGLTTDQNCLITVLDEAAKQSARSDWCNFRSFELKNPVLSTKIQKTASGFLRNHIQVYWPVDFSLSNGSGGFLFDRLLKAARAGSKEALGQLFECCRPYLLKIANEDLPRNLHIKTAPSDAVQDSFLLANRDFPNFRGESEAEFKAWLKRILSNKVAEQSRVFDTDIRDIAREVKTTGEGRGQLLDLLAASGHSPRAEAIANELRHDLQMGLDKLPEDQRQVVQLRVYERLSYPEIAVLLSRSDDACRQLFKRALGNLRKMIGSDDDT